MLSLTAFADELEREKARQRTYDAMLRKARAGHVTGGRVFGYDNVDVAAPRWAAASHVERRINEAEAAVVGAIFDRLRRGARAEGNREGAQRERSVRRRGRSRAGRSAWAPSSVREVLHRDAVPGRRSSGTVRGSATPGARSADARDRRAEWFTVPADQLRIVSDAMWRAAHDRISRRRGLIRRVATSTYGGRPDGRGVRKRYFLSGFGRCAILRRIDAGGLARVERGPDRVGTSAARTGTAARPSATSDGCLRCRPRTWRSKSFSEPKSSGRTSSNGRSTSCSSGSASERRARRVRPGCGGSSLRLTAPREPRRHGRQGRRRADHPRGARAARARTSGAAA